MTDPPTWYVYVLRCSDGTLYCGSTTDVVRRLEEHNGSDEGAKYTRTRRPVHLLNFWSFPNRSAAQQAEAFFKKRRRKEKLEILDDPNLLKHRMTGHL